MGLDQKTMGVLKLYLRDYPIEDNQWHLFDKWGVQDQPWAAREGKRGLVYRYREEDPELIRAIIVNYFDPPKPLAPGQKAKRTTLDEDDDGSETPTVLAVLPYINCVTWHPESQDQVNHFTRETYHFFHPAGTGRFLFGYQRSGISHWTEEHSDLGASDDGLEPFVLERLQEIQDETVVAAIADVQSSAPPAGEDELVAGLRDVFESTDHIKPYWKPLEIYEMPGPLRLALYPN